MGDRKRNKTKYLQEFSVWETGIELLNNSSGKMWLVLIVIFVKQKEYIYLKIKTICIEILMKEFIFKYNFCIFR